MVSEHQPKDANAIIRYQTYRPRVMVSGHHPKVANADDKISDLSARGDPFGASAEGCKCRS